MKNLFGFERERAEAGEFCERQSLDEKLGIAVLCERARQSRPLRIKKSRWFLPSIFF